HAPLPALPAGGRVPAGRGVVAACEPLGEGAMTFSRPDLLWLVPCLPLVVAVGVYRYSRRRRRFLELLGEPGLIQRLGAAGLDAFPTRSLVLVGLAAAALGFAAAGPRWGTEVVESRSRALNL